MGNYILFDLDGTLSDPYEGISKSYQYAFSRFGITIDDPDILKKFIGPPLREAFCAYGLDPAEAIPVYRERYGTIGLYENTLYDGIVPLLERLTAAGHTLAIASSKAEVYVKRTAEHFGITKYFAFIGGSEFDGRRSDKAEVIRYVVAALSAGDFAPGITPGAASGSGDGSAIYMVGDREHDIIGAKKCGVTSVGVLYGYGSRGELEAAGADYIAEDIDALGGYLE